MALPNGFTEEVYAVVGQIPEGRVASYGQIAWLVGMPGCARQVGQVLASASERIPCHRVVGSTGHTVAHWPEQREQLEREGVLFRPGGRVDMAACRWEIAPEKV